MAWRSSGVTGSNNVPLGNRRRFGSERDSPRNGTPDGYNPSQPSAGFSDIGQKRGRSPNRSADLDAAVEAAKPRKRKNRWGDATENKAAGLMGLPTMIQANMTSEQLDAYTLHLRIEEISQKLRINDVVPAEKDRSPSPPPQYDNFGKRVNTREQRYRKRLEEERHKLIERAMKIIPSYHPPSDYRRPTKTQEKVYVPVNDYPEINFIGLLIGPRGNTLKKMETESQAKIAIRGKGSVKEGKGRSDAAHSSNQEEDLHCLIMADTEEKVNKAKKLIHNVIETAASIPEGQNELKRNQLRELAALNGTLRDDENQACQNCGEIGHRKYDCPNQRNYTANIICRICGNAGHMARDCTERSRGSDWRNGEQGGLDNGNAARITGGDADDDEYESLMQSLGAPGGGAGPQRRIEGGPGGYDNQNNYGGQRESKPAPWQRSSGGAPPWQQRRDERESGASRPWNNSGRGRDSHGGYDQHGHGEHNGYGHQYGGYDSGQPGAPAPWRQHAAPPPPPPAHGYGGYPGYQGYDQGYSQPGYQHGAPGYGDYGEYGHGAAPPPPPGLGPLFHNYGHAPGYDQPPPPPGDDIPPPPPPSNDQPPPPPPPPEA